MINRVIRLFIISTGIMVTSACSLLAESKKQRSVNVLKKVDGQKSKSAIPVHPGKPVFVWPIDQHNFWLSSYFGLRTLPNGIKKKHHGIDMASRRGTPVYAAADGTVVHACYMNGYGKTVYLAHKVGYQTRYAHLNSIRVEQGQTVHAGQQIGTVGDTGFTLKSGKDASHLHFEILKSGNRIDPLTLLPPYETSATSKRI